MDTEILYKSIIIEGETRAYLDYYIIPESISASYTNLKCYGIKIEKTTIYEGGGKIIDTRQMNNVFYRYSDVCEFLECATDKRVDPYGLKAYVEKYIIESLDRAKQKA